MSSSNQLVEIGSLPQGKYHAIDFVNENQGWVVGDGGAIFHTTNGGKTWLKQASGTTDDLMRVQFVDEDFGWVAGTRAILHTENGGLSWTKQLSDSSQSKFVCMCFVNRFRGWVRGPSVGTIYRTVNGGAQWEVQQIGESIGVTDISFVNENVGYVLLGISRICKTTDGGNQWNKISGPRFPFSICFLSEQTGFIGNDINASSLMNDRASIFRTDDGGNTWSEQTIPKTATVWKIAFANSEKGWALAGGFTERELLLYTTNGGQIWNQIENRPANTQFVDFAVLDEIDVWVLGSSGQIFKINFCGCSIGD
ncbi:MAG: YCF48-related protein [candidate division KSB1 bacterium]|nr:YCF48-related protein [candidate division KSB1 bacterium]MDZ7303938.1 YCF48-related protein [candidate division KSB1 bacterium]MDZ7313099.1 YCF48-related protein [candidate division KSB1 bacterium]